MVSFLRETSRCELQILINHHQNCLNLEKSALLNDDTRWIFQKNLPGVSRERNGFASMVG